MTADISYVSAVPSELGEVRRILRSAELPHADLTPASLETFLCAKSDSCLIGVAGLETFGTIAMVRSLAVEAAFRGRGIGSELLLRIESLARNLRVDDLYALTLTIEQLLLRREYRGLPRADAPQAIQDTPEFRGLCPDSAALLVKTLR